MAVQVKDAGSRQLEKKRFWKEVGRQKVLLIWAAVFVVYGFVFCYLPLAGWLMAFQNYKPKDGLFGSQFVGLAKFQQLFSDDTFLGVIRNTLAMGVLNLVTTFVMAILFAIGVGVGKLGLPARPEDTPGRQAAAKQYVAEALADEEGLTVESVMVDPAFRTIPEDLPSSTMTWAPSVAVRTTP